MLTLAHVVMIFCFVSAFVIAAIGKKLNERQFKVEVKN